MRLRRGSARLEQVGPREEVAGQQDRDMALERLGHDVTPEDLVLVGGLHAGDVGDRQVAKLLVVGIETKDARRLVGQLADLPW